MSFLRIKDWSGKTVIITGAATGVGKGLCKELAARGAIVYVTARSIEKCQPVADEINGSGHTAYAQPLNVDNAEEFKTVINHIREKHGKLDVLFNNAAIVFVGEYYDMDEEDINKLVHTNLTSVLTGTLYAYRLMREQGFGTIVNITSMGGFLPATSMVAYSATKHALVGLTQSLAAEARDFGISVKAMALGLVESEMLKNARVKHGSGTAVLETVPMKPMPTTKAVKILVDGMRKKKMLIFVPGYAKFYHYFNRWFPRLVFKGSIAAMKKYRELIKQNSRVRIQNSA